jgi:hypothetical protein
MEENKSNLTISEEDKAQLARMYSELKKELKKYSKNELIRIVGSTLIDLQIAREALKAATTAQEVAK